MERRSRDHVPKIGRLHDTVSYFWGFSHCHDTHVKTQCCGSHPCGPTVDRHSSVDSGDQVRVRTSSLRQCQSSRTSFLSAAFTSPAPLVFQDLYIIASVLAMDVAPCGVWSRLVAEVLVSGSVHTHVARMMYLGSGFQHSGRLATSGSNASRCGKEAKRRTQLGTQPRLSSAPAVRLRRGVESLGPQAHFEEVLR